MKRGQTGIGLVILGVVAIIAVIGLVLLFTRASKTQGAALLDLSVGNIYGGGTVPGEGIGVTVPTPEYMRSRGYQYPVYPGKAYPAYTQYPGGVRSYGTRIPGVIVAGMGRGGFASLDEKSACTTDLHLGAGILAPGDTFNWYQVPEEGGDPEVKGFFPGDSSAQSRITVGNPRGNTGGNSYGYVNSLGAEGQGFDSEDLVRDRIVRSIKAHNGRLGNHAWGIANVKGKEVGICYAGSREFPFPQG